MAIITPNNAILLGRLGFGVVRYDQHEMSGETGSSGDRLMSVPRWKLMMQSPDRIDAAAMDYWRQVLVKLRGRVNYLAMWDVGRPAPRGTMRGTMSLNASLLQGDTSMTITAGGGQAGTTLEAGDWLQISSGLTGQLVMITDGGTANGSGVITVNFEHPIRASSGYPGGTAVTWDKALGHYKMMSESVQWFYDGGLLQSGAAGDFLEQW